MNLLDSIVDDLILASDGDLEKMDELITGGKEDNDDTSDE